MVAVPAKESTRPPGLSLAVGELVVYGSHGIGAISAGGATGARRKASELVVVEFPNGLSVSLPVERAYECLRPVSGKAEVASVRKALRSTDSVLEDSWQVRTRAARSKIASGEAVGLAEVVRDAVLREGLSTPRGEAVRLSPDERDLYLKARRLLAAEVGASNGLEEAEADAWIDDQLVHARRDGPESRTVDAAA